MGVLIKSEDELRKSKNANYENYMPEHYDTSYLVNYPKSNQTPENKGESKKFDIILGITIVAISVLVMVIVGTFYPSPEYEQLAKKEFEAKNYEKAIEYTDKYLGGNPDDTNVLLLKANSLYLLEKYDEK